MTPSSANRDASVQHMAFATAWPSAKLKDIVERDDLRIAPFRDDGTTPGTATWIWCVEVAGELYVRAYHGIRSSWHRAACRQKAGMIETGGTSVAVSFESADESQSELIDSAYRQKYAGSPYVAHMTAQGARAATVRIVRRAE